MESSDKYVSIYAQLGTRTHCSTHCNIKSVNLVVEYTGCRRNRAINALYKSNDDIVKAIMLIQNIQDV